MNRRDAEILNSLKQFRVLNRDQIIRLHFQNVKDKINSANKVLKRLQRDGHILCDPSSRPFLYFPNPSTLKKNSGKTNHFSEIANFFIEASEIGSVREYQVEPKLGQKGTVEPDLFFIWEGTPFFVEIQRSNEYNKKYMKKKLERYGAYFYGEEWKTLPWQKKSVKRFPYVLVISDREYSLEEQTFRVFQSRTMEEFMIRYTTKKERSS